MDPRQPAGDRALHRAARRAHARRGGLTSPVRALLLHAANVPAGWRRVLVDTVNARVGLREKHLPRPLRSSARARFAVAQEYETLSYVLDWKEAFERSPRLSVEACDVNDAWALRQAERRMRDYELVIVLHSAAGDDLGRIRGLAHSLQGRGGKLLILFGNEYALMHEKIQLASETGADFIGTQLPLAAGRWLYEGVKAEVLAAPPGLNPDLYRPLGLERKVAIGFRGVRYDNAFALGDVTRDRAIDSVDGVARRLGLTADVRYERLPREEWAAFLNECRSVVGAESGTRYLERDDTTRRAVADYVAANPQAPFDEVFERFFAGRQGAVSGKAISSRHFEPLGTETLQLLVEGEYNGLLQPGVHYVALRPDLSNVEEAIRQAEDASYRRAITARAREYALDAHTYDHRVADLLRRCLD